VKGKISMKRQHKYNIMFFQLMNSSKNIFLKKSFIKSALPLAILVSLDESVNSSYLGLTNLPGIKDISR